VRNREDKRIRHTKGEEDCYCAKSQFRSLPEAQDCVLLESTGTCCGVRGWGQGRGVARGPVSPPGAITARRVSTLAESIGGLGKVSPQKGHSVKTKV